MPIQVPGFEVPDVGDDITTLIDREWDPANTENEMPHVQFVNDLKRVRWMGEDAVVVTSLQEFIYPATLQYLYENASYTFTVQTFTGVSRARGQMMMEELRRVLMKNRINPLDGITDMRANSWLWIRRHTDNVQRWRLTWRWTADCELKVRFRPLRT